MMLTFERGSELVNGRRVRRRRFERRSRFPVSAACLVANSARETLSAAFAQPVRLRLLEPVIPDAAGWSSIEREAVVFGVRGRMCDAALVFRSGDALAVAGAAFGERPHVPRPLSSLETDVLSRLVIALRGSLLPVCGGNEQPEALPIETLAGFVTYFELLLEAPLQARIGIAMSRDPAPESNGAAVQAHLSEVPIELRAEIASGMVPASALAELRIGSLLTLDSRIGETALLRAGRALVARGECGDVAGRAVFIAS